MTKKQSLNAFFTYLLVVKDMMAGYEQCACVCSAETTEKTKAFDPGTNYIFTGTDSGQQ